MEKDGGDPNPLLILLVMGLMAGAFLWVLFKGA
jgi:hypothetical protein